MVFLWGEKILDSLLDLLPKGGNSLVDSLQNEEKYLRRLLFLIQEAEEGIQHFLKGNLSHFDPHVGDTACQIRAYYFALLWQEREVHTPPLEKDRSQLRQYAEKIMIVLERSQQGIYRDKRPVRLDTFLEDLGVSLKLSELGLILTISHVLSKYRWMDEEGISQRLDYLRMQRDLRESNLFVKNFLRHFQQRLSLISVQFILKLAEALSDLEDFTAKPEVLNYLLCQGDENRSLLPSFATLEVILKHMRYCSKIPVVFSLSLMSQSSLLQKELYVEPIGDQWVMRDLRPLEFSAMLIDREGHINPLCFVVRAISLNNTMIPNEDYIQLTIEKLKNVGFETALLWVNADHPQYIGRYIKSDKTIMPLSVSEYVEKYRLLKERSFLEGCSIRNPYFFYTIHFNLATIQEVKGIAAMSLSKLQRILKTLMLRAAFMYEEGCNYADQ